MGNYLLILTIDIIQFSMILRHKKCISIQKCIIFKYKLGTISDSPLLKCQISNLLLS